MLIFILGLSIGLLSDWDKVFAEPGAELELVRSSAVKRADGVIVRTFSGRAAPSRIIIDPRNGRPIRLYEYFPNRNDPIAIRPDFELGEGGYELKTVDLGLAGVIPSPGDVPWDLNMIPFGIALDGTIFDPSGPWYDGGPLDPTNAFDSRCTGWEYEALHPKGRQALGLPDVAPGHVQPGGRFHYHGYPDALIAILRARNEKASAPSATVLAGYSADGYPIIDHVINARAAAGEPAFYLFSGYVLREGKRAALERTNPAFTPPGDHDGLFVQDYVFDPKRKSKQIEAALAERGEYFGLKAEDVRAGRAVYALLDIRNGYLLKGPNQVLPGYPASHYAYALTPDWPQVPRLFAFEPDESFKRVIPFQFPHGAFGRLLTSLGLRPQGRKSLYTNCPQELAFVHITQNRLPY